MHSRRLHSVRSVGPLLVCLLALLAACQSADPDGFPIIIVADGVERDLVVMGPTVREALAEAKVTLGDADRVEPPEFTLLERDLVIQVIRVTEAYTVTQAVVPFERKTVRNESLPAGETRMLQAGTNGLRELTVRVVYEDGAEVDRRVVREVLITAPVDEVIMVGSRGTLVPVPISGTLVYLDGGNPWVVAGNTAVRRPLDASGDLDGRVFALSPDGKELLYTRAAPVMTNTDNVLLNTLWRVSIAERGKPASTAITSVLNLTWSPQGDAFAYTTGERVTQSPGWQANNDLWQATIQDDGRLRLGRVRDSSAGGAYGWWGTQYAWQPLGRLLAYARADETGTISLDQGALRPLSAIQVFRTYGDWVWVPTPAWSTDGEYLYLVLHGPPPPRVAPEDSRVFDLWALGPSSGVAVKLVADCGMWAYPAPSKWGIAYLQALDPEDSALGRYALYVMDRDGSNQRLLFPPAGDPGLKPQRVAWAPTGREIALVYQGDIYLVDIETGTARQVTSDGESSNPQWGP